MTSLTSRLSARNQRDYSPVAWTKYFDEAHDIGFEADENQGGEEISPNRRPDQTGTTKDSFRVYLRNFRQPYAPKREFGQILNPNQAETSHTELNQYNQIPTLVALHGGGYSGLSWAKFTRYIEQLCHCRVLAIDLRGHGDTKTRNDNQMDINTLVRDVISVTHATHRLCGFPETPRIILIGHSMGGAIAIKCSTNCPETLPSLTGFVIIDVVEGTAKDALPLMMSVIKTRPAKFPSLKNAIEWSVRSGMAKNIDAARVSMPGNLLNVAQEHLAIHDIDYGEDKRNLLDTLKRHKFPVNSDSLIGPVSPIVNLPPNMPLPPRISALKANLPMGPPAPPPPLGTPGGVSGVINELSEDSESCELDISHSVDRQRREECDGNETKPADANSYCWRTNLAKTQPHWNGWFDGLSEQLLNSPVQAKFLLLAGIDRLDKALTIGHMQGKFMMKVLPKCGHAVHEDVPEQVASVIGDFLVRNKLTVSMER